MSERNPSRTLTVEQLDDIVDRVIRGKYEKKKPAHFLEVAKTGLCHSSFSVECYVRYRWPELSKAGHTMRSNKLSSKIAKVLQGSGLLTHPDVVWRIMDPNGTEICFATGGEQGVKGWAFAAFRFRMPNVKTAAQLGAYWVGIGGQAEAATRNLELATRVGDSIIRQKQVIVNTLHTIECLELAQEAVKYAGEFMNTQLAAKNKAK